MPHVKTPSPKSNRRWPSSASRSATGVDRAAEARAADRRSAAASPATSAPRLGVRGGAGHGENPGERDGPEPHGLHERPEFGRGRSHGSMGGPHARRLGDALGAARFRLLERLVEGSASISELADAIGVDQPRASRLVADAAARGLVQRTPDPTDARRTTVDLTDAGRSFLATLKDSRRSAVITALEGFSAEDTATFAALLSRFVQHWPASR